MLNLKPLISPLHQLDSFVCDYLVGTIAGCWLDLSDRGIQLREWFFQGLNEPGLSQYIDDHDKCWLLNEPELQRILMALEAPPQTCRFDWVPWPSLHESYSLTLREIRGVLGETAAEDFTEKVFEIVRQLKQPELPLHRGAELVVEWIDLIRGMKRALGLDAFLPLPQGPLPTPTSQRSKVDLKLPAEQAGHDSSDVQSQDLNVAELARLMRCDVDQVDQLLQSVQPSLGSASTQKGLELADPNMPYVPASWFHEEFGISPERLRSARRDERIQCKKTRDDCFHYSVPDAMRLWPADVLYLPGFSGRVSG